MEYKRIGPKTHCLLTRKAHIPCHFLDDKNVVLMDTGWYGQEGALLLRHLEERGLRPAGILLSHAHEDHMGNIAALKVRYGCPVAAAGLEAHFARSAWNMKLNYPYMSVDTIESFFDSQFFETDISLPEADGLVVMGGRAFEVVHTPGHSPAHLCFVSPDGTAYLGDVMMSADVMEHLRMPYAFDLARQFDSMKKAAAIKADRYVLAHNAVADHIAPVYEQNLAFYRTNILGVFELAARPKTRGELLAGCFEVFRLKTDMAELHIFIGHCLDTYLQFLMDIGAVECATRGAALLYHGVDRGAVEQAIYR